MKTVFSHNYINATVTLLFSEAVVAAPMWELGELNYQSGESEVSAFINTEANTQLQSVMCTKNLRYDHRFTLLLPSQVNANLVIEAHLNSDSMITDAFGEVSGNSIDFQIDEALISELPDTSQLVFHFDKNDATYLGIPEVLEIPMTAADLSIRKAASECTALALNSGYSCNKRLISSILWPRNGFDRDFDEDIDKLCTTVSKAGARRFNLSSGCKFALDRFYKQEGTGPLSFLNDLFNKENSLYNQYATAWNEAVDLAPVSTSRSSVYADGREWYILLYSLVSGKHISSFTNSYYEIKNLRADPTTLIYDYDNRYEMETLKYSSVLFRRIQSSIQACEAFTKALKLWNEFYRELQVVLPNLNQAQALRPVIYRTMLMRIWRLAGNPRGIKLDPKKIFVQGINGKTSSDDYLEGKCSFFDGANGEEFFFATEGCLKGIYSAFKSEGLKREEFEEVEKAWDAFAQAWNKSIFFTDSIDDAVGENIRSNLGLAMISSFRSYGFGDYFLMRQCFSSEDSDICDYEANKYYDVYVQELQNRLDSISEVSVEDAKLLNDLNDLWKNYYLKLSDYLNMLCQKGKLSPWRVGFVKGTVIVAQTNALLSFIYDREELPDTSIYIDEF